MPIYKTVCIDGLTLFHCCLIARQWHLKRVRKALCPQEGKDTLADIYFLSYDVASESEILPCIKIDKPLVVYRFSRKVMK